MNSAAAARCGCDPAEGVFFGCPSVVGGPPFVGTWGEGELPRGKSFRSCAVSGGLRRGERFCAGQTLSLVRRVERPSPRGAFLRGTNPFARAPCREAFAVGSAPARGKFFRPCAVSGGLRRGACSCAGPILSLVRRVERPSPWGALLRGANSFAGAPCR